MSSSVSLPNRPHLVINLPINTDATIKVEPIVALPLTPMLTDSPLRRSASMYKLPLPAISLDEMEENAKITSHVGVTILQTKEKKE